MTDPTLDPEHLRDLDLTSRRPKDAELQIEALTREVERLTVLASRDRGLVESILDVSPYGIIVCDAQGRLTLLNKAAERIWAGSASAEGVAEWGKYRGFHPDGRPYEGRDWAMARCLEHGETVQPEEMRIQRFDDSFGVLLGGSAPIRGPDGAIQGAVSIFADVTKLKETEEALRLGSARYLTTLRSIGDAVIATDANDLVTFMNPVAERLTKLDAEAARGQPLAAVFRIDPAIAIDDRASPILDDDGAQVGSVLVFRDVTEARREQTRRRFLLDATTLLGSSLEYATTLASVARLAVPTIADWCAVDIAERGGKVSRLAVAHVDPAKVRLAEELAVRYPPDPASRHGVHEVIRTGKAQLFAEIPDELLVAEARDAEHLRLARELGLRSAMIVPLRARGKALGAITFVAAESGRQFSTADLGFAEELANAAGLAVDNASLYREAQEASRAKDEFLATVSHELRTPLSAVLGWAHLLQQPEMPDAKRLHALRTIERNAQAQVQLIDDLLDVSRIISGQLRLEPTEVDLDLIVDAAVDAIGPTARTKGVDVQVLHERTSTVVNGDAARLQQIVWNLLSNGVKFTPKGGRVTVRLGADDGQVELDVTDTGLGIDARFLPHVFERFKQADATSRRSHGGLGLGLAIVRHLLDLHGGTVSAESAGAGQGSTFRVRLPMVPLRRPHVPEPDPAITAARRVVAPSLEGLRVLLVDDEDDARDVLAEILRRGGAQVAAVASAAEALREVQRRVPDVLVSDIGMPGEDGYGLIRKVRAFLEGRPMPAVALTAYARKDDRTRALMAGFQSHVAKPVEPDELLVVVATLAGRTDEAS